MARCGRSWQPLGSWWRWRRAAAAAGAARPAAYCDNVKALEAAADPLSDQAIYADPAKLQAALQQRVTAYDRLAGTAPASIKAAADTVRDAFVKLDAAFQAKRYESAAANADPGIAAILSDPAVAAAAQSLTAFDKDTCGIG